MTCWTPVRQLFDLLAMAGFRLGKWSSNEPVVTKDIPEEDRLPTLAINKDDWPRTKTLGVMWEVQRDVFTFRVEQPPLDSKKPTKRNVLSAIASLLGTVHRESQDIDTGNMDSWCRLGR